eukprot:175341-Chlamydomonas_euryale.AAC.3
MKDPESDVRAKLRRGTEMTHETCLALQILTHPLPSQSVQDSPSVKMRPSKCHESRSIMMHGETTLVKNWKCASWCISCGMWWAVR